MIGHHMRRIARSGPTDVAPLALHAGPLELSFDPGIAFIRQIRWEGREILRAIYGAVRDRNWQTIPPRISRISLQQDHNSFELSFRARCKNPEVHFTWEGRIAGTADGEIRFEFSGEAKRDFWRNRVGLCVLHPIAGCAGAKCRIIHPDGSRLDTRFPRLVSPNQPFLDVKTIGHQIVPGVFTECAFEGEVFETEDQRNWTDTSFKTYGTPLSRPFPVLLQRGARVQQVVTFRVIDKRPTKPARRRKAAARPEAPEVVTLEVNFDRLRGKPRVGFGVAAEQGPPCRAAHDLLLALQPAHLRVDCRLMTKDWRQRLEQAMEQGRRLATDLHVAIHVGDSAREELTALRAASTGLGLQPALWLVFHEHQKCTAPDWVMLAREILGPVAPRAQFAAGTDFNFAELNRARPPADADWLPCFSINPQVHSRDDLSLMENLDAQGEVARSARAFSRQSPVISPVTLLPRQNPDATSAEPNKSAPPADARQASWFGAAWTFGSLATLTSAGRVHSLTYFETHGPRGLVTGGRQPGLFPVYHVFAGYAGLVRLARVEPAVGNTRQRVAVLAGVTKAGRRVVWLANLTRETALVDLDVHPRFRAASVIELSAAAMPGLASDPESWWKKAPPRRLGTKSPSVELSAHALARVELEELT